MKFQNLASFEKHLHSSSVCSTYLIGCSDVDERHKLICGVVQWLAAKYPGAQVYTPKGAKDPFSHVVENLSTRPLFASHVVVRLDDFHDLSKKEKEIVEGFILKPSAFAFLVVGSSSLKEMASVCAQAKNDMVVLDLTQEKPWDRQKRLQQWLVERCSREGKKISLQLATEIIEACGSDMMLAEQELLKVITYVGARISLQPEDCKAVGIRYTMPTGWQLADALLWDKKAPLKDPSFSLSDLLPLLGQVRYHIHLGRQFAVCVALGHTKEEIGRHFSSVRPQAQDRYLQLAHTYPPPFFEEVAKCLFKIELLSKNSNLSAPFLWDYLVAQIAKKKVQYAKKNSTRSLA